jgi:hypothetical protein
MLSTDERRLVAGILALLLFGAVVKMCRQQAAEKDIPQVHLPSVEPAPKAVPDER